MSLLTQVRGTLPINLHHRLEMRRTVRPGAKVKRFGKDLLATMLMAVILTAVLALRLAIWLPPLYR